MALHRAVRAPQNGKVARATREKVSVGEKEALGMRLARLDALQELGVFDAPRVMAQIGACIQLGAKLGKGPALDEAYLRLGHIAARQLLEDLERGHRLRE